MNKKRFKINDRFKKNDKKVILLLIIFVLVLFISPICQIFNEMIQTEGDKTIYIFFFIMILLLMFVTFIPLFGIYSLIRHVINKNIRKKATFDIVNDIDYYRDNFGEISPSLISLMIDLDIEEEKDLTAMLLFYKLNNIITVENNNIILNQSVTLNESDKKFFEWFKSRNIADFATWKNSIKMDAINNGYIVPNKEESKKKGCLIPLVILIGAIIIFIYLISIIMNPSFDIKNSIYVTLIIISITLVALIITITPIFSLIYFVANKLSSNKIKRTEKGNELTEKIYAMKNFIHDFGNLSEATKESLCVWDYFLIYAVVLEENSVIIDEISSYYNSDMISLVHKSS